ncbi:family 27 glycoside hydrolase [Melampsora larici-populina 98AG31]|uniref:Alpha-galactosidase n=1 Tax=Melampsora larici-populina (strain 98AG31 / pathotype 3-4-7) TaxID=747676 RepID=F4RTC8_MELLP|nr:family 27 glycoside hydrolase [Melampsora larici-populina 98AG31]EGG04239.1 family 27 glycoside hydrolase [Melampsora larici-populina 98AG31]
MPPGAPLPGQLPQPPNQKRPPLGFTSSQYCQWNDYGLKPQVDVLERTGLKDLGFKTFVIACEWNKGMDPEGKLIVDDKQFEGGLTGFGRFLQDKQMKFGLRIDSVTAGCPWPPKKKKKVLGIFRRSDENEKLGLNSKQLQKRKGDYPPLDPSRVENQFQQIASWGVTHLEYRPCLFVTAGAIQNPDLSKVTNDPYIQMKQSIQRSQKDIFLATGQWGVTDETRLETADTWRVNNPAKEDWQKIRQTINAMVALSHKSAPGHFNDLDAIDWNHRDLSPMEQATQVIFWAATKSPLLLTGDLNQDNPSILGFLKNKALIDINQDALGKSITFRRRYTNDNDVWAGELSDGSMVAMLINWKDEERELTLSLADVELTSANGFDVISGKDLGPSNTTQSKTKGMGKAVLRPVTDKLQAMTYLEPDGVGAVQFVNLEGGDKGGRLLVAIDYINSKLDDFSPSWCPNCLIAKIKVNDAPEVEIEFPITGLTNNIPMSYLVELDGFKPGSDNTLTYTGAHKQAAPDITQVSFFSASAPSGYQ